MLDLCHELYVSGQENVFWQPENEEHQRRRWLAPKVEAPKPVSKVPKPVPAAVPGQASTCAPVALTSQRAHRTTQPSTMASYVVGQTSPAHELSRTYAVNATDRRLPPSSCNSHIVGPSCIGSRKEPCPSVPAHHPAPCRAIEAGPPNRTACHDAGDPAGGLHARAGASCPTIRVSNFSRDVLPRLPSHGIPRLCEQPRPALARDRACLGFRTAS